jgi:hypothetical protein
MVVKSNDLVCGHMHDIVFRNVPIFGMKVNLGMTNNADKWSFHFLHKKITCHFFKIQKHYKKVFLARRVFQSAQPKFPPKVFCQQISFVDD